MFNRNPAWEESSLVSSWWVWALGTAVPRAGMCWWVPMPPPALHCSCPTVTGSAAGEGTPVAHPHGGISIQHWGAAPDWEHRYNLLVWFAFALQSCSACSVSQTQLFSDVSSHHSSCCCLCFSSFLNLVIETIRAEICSEQLKWLHEKTDFLRAV